MKPSALVTRRLLPGAMEYLRGKIDFEVGADDRSLSKSELIKKIAGRQGLLSQLTDRVDEAVMAAAPGLKIIANCAVGYDNIDLKAARARGILVTNTPGVLTEATADLTWALILAVARRIPEAERFARAGRYHGWELDLLLGKDITGARLGIVGMGRIGKAVAERASAFRMQVVYSDPRELPASEAASIGAVRVTFEELLATSDVVSLHTTLTEETRHLVSAPQLEAMKADAILINVSRGPVVDEKALVKALAGKKIWGAGLDVFEREPEIEEGLKNLDNVVLLPHIGSATHGTRLNMSLTAARNLVQGLSGETPDSLVG